MKCICCFIYCSCEEMEVKNYVPTTYARTELNNDPIIELNPKRKRKSINRRTYTKIWLKLYPGLFSGVCKLCNTNEISLTDTSSWEASHIIPFSKGGDETLENLIPLCKNCNRSMGKKTVQDYAKEKYPSDYKNILIELKVSES